MVIDMFARLRPRRGFTMVELVVTMGILVFLIGAVYGLMGNARTVFFDMSMGTQLRDELRQAMQKVELELRNTGHDSVGNAQFVIAAGAGVNGTDTIRFSVPVTCSTATTFLNTSGYPANWGAGLTWGCNSSSCMDANNSCTILEYKYVKYALNNSAELERTVLDTALTKVASAVIGRNLIGLTFAYNGGTKTLTVTMTAQKYSGTRRLVTETVSQDIRLMN